MVAKTLSPSRRWHLDFKRPHEQCTHKQISARTSRDANLIARGASQDRMVVYLGNSSNMALNWELSLF